VALSFLVPKFLPVAKCLPYLTAGNENVIGRYRAVLHSHLPKSVKLSDLPAVLRHLQRQKQIFRPSGHLTELSNAAVKLALRHFETPAVRRSLVRFWVSRLPHHDSLPRWAEICPSGISVSAGTKLRREFTKEILQAGGAREVQWSNLHPEPDDLGWLLDELVKARPRQRPAWADLAARLCCRPERMRFEARLRDAYRSCAELRSALPTPKRYDIVTTLDRNWRAWEIRRQRNESRQQIRLREESREPWLNRALAGLQGGDARWWSELVRVVWANDPHDETRG
jgi:hypothetical protein